MSEGTATGVMTEASAATVQILFVDDDREWARLVASDIETAADEFEVTVAGSAREGVEIVQEQADVDCIVADYRMPGMDGFELLERVREDHPRLPYLLVTSQGSESVAARAIAAGVTDYLIKQPSSDQTVQFVNRIRTAVERYRLRQALEASEERYRTVVEQSRDAIVIVRDGCVRFCNQRLVELTGKRREQLRAAEFVTETVHRDDQKGVDAVFDGWAEGNAEPAVQELRIVQPDGAIRHCECTGRPVDYEDEPALLVSIRDVTERQRRERELEWERALNRAIQEALVESPTRSDLERTVTEQLQRHGYALAWIAEQAGAQLVPRVVAGDREYVDAISRSLEGDGDDEEPAIRAAQTGSSQFLDDFAERSPGEWREAAVEYGYRGGAALPLVYNDVTYGVLAVYRGRVERFDDTERRLLRELADTVAFAIHSLETQGALAADQTVEATVQVGEGYYLLDLAGDGVFDDSEAVQVRGTVPLDDETVTQYVDVDGGSVASLRDEFGGHSDVRGVVVLSEEDPVQLQVTVRAGVPEARLASRGVVVSSTTLENDRVSIEIELPNRREVRSTVEALEESCGDVSVRTINERESETKTARPRDPAAADLTEKQLTALEAAYYNGYFEQPRQRSASEIAELLDVSHPTFLHHLRAAQRKQFERQFE